MLEVEIHKDLGSFSLDVSFTAGSGVLALLGGSGSGKSMTLRCIAGVEKPDRGRIVCDGTVFYDSEKKIDLTPQQRQVGLLFQNYALFPTMTALENIMAGVRTGSRAEKRRRAEEALRRYQLEGLGDRYPRELSGGQQQRVLLARALCATRRLLLLDEPVSGLDPKVTGEMYGLIEQLNRDGISIIMISHDISASVKYASHILHIGAETFFGTSHEYLHSPIGQKYLELEGGELHCSKHWHSISPIPSSDTP